MKKQTSDKTSASTSPSSSSAHQNSPSALRSPLVHLRVWAIATLGLILDLWTKRWALNAVGIPPDSTQPLHPDQFPQPINIIDDTLRFITVYNRGAVAGAFAGKTLLLILASIAALVFLLWFLSTTTPRQWSRHLAIGLLIGGALGNLYDRIFNDGRVIDFIEVNLHVWPANPWPTFNVADILLTVGVAWLLLTLLFTEQPKSPQQ